VLGGKEPDVVDIQKEHAIETYKSLMQYGSAGIKFILVANGSAAIAVMTFLGHFVSKGSANVPDMRLPLALFLLGVLAGGFATFTAYFTQLTLYNESMGARVVDKGVTHVVWLRRTVGVMLLGMIAFASGAGIAVWRLQ
jgi:hypothetical protein